MAESRCNEYRDLLETWTAWWNGPGRRYFDYNVLPPLKATAEALACSICQGENLPDGERCEACGRRGRWL